MPESDPTALDAKHLKAALLDASGRRPRRRRLMVGAPASPWQGTEPSKQAAPFFAVPTVFLSYAHDDQLAAAELAAALGRHAIPVWWDRALRSGEVFDLTIEKALEASAAVVVLWSAAAAKSLYVRDEAKRGFHAGKLVSICIDGFAFGSLPIGLGHVQTTPASDIDAVVRSLVRLGFSPHAPATPGLSRSPRPKSLGLTRQSG